MKCQNCGCVGVENQANGKSFWFCRACRIEIVEPINFDWEERDSHSTIPTTHYTIGSTLSLPPSTSAQPVSPFDSLVKKSSIAATYFGVMSQSGSQGVRVNVPIGPTLSLSDWLPALDPKPGDNFCGFDRSIDPTRLSGVRRTIRWKGMSPGVLVAAFVAAAHRVYKEGGVPDILLVPSHIHQVLGMGKGIRSHFVINALFGSIDVWADPTLPSDTVFLLQLNTWEEMNGTLVCDAPGHNARILLA